MIQDKMKYFMVKKKGLVFLHFIWSKKLNLKNLISENLKYLKKGWKYDAGQVN